MNRLEHKYTLPKRIEDNIMLCFFKLAVQAGLTVFNFIDGLVDEFEDETGVGTKTNAVYDNSNDLYSPKCQAIIAKEISTGMNSSWRILGSGGVEEEESGKIYLGAAAAVPKIEVYLAKGGTPTDNVIVRIETDNSGPSGTLVDANATVTLPYTSIPGSYGWVTFTFPAEFTLSASTTYWLVIKRSGARDTVNYYSTHIANPSAGEVAGTKNNGTWDIVSGNNMGCPMKLYKIGTATFENMTLLSNAVTAEAQPNQGRIVLFEEDVDAVTVNTDIKSYVSRDGGTTWTQLTLVDEGDYETGKRILSSAAVAISAQPAGTSMKWKAETLNNKNLKLHAVGVNWD